MSKPAYSLEQQLNLLKERGMLFKDEQLALHFLKNISYYRLKGYWWDMQEDKDKHIFKKNTYFDEVIERYNFDRQLRIILFDAIERIEIGVRTKMIYHLSLRYGGLWYLDSSIFKDSNNHQEIVADVDKEVARSKEVFIKEHHKKYPDQKPESWKALEVVSFTTLSKLYAELKDQLPEKAKIANEMGLNLHNELSSWLHSISYIRNIIAHHSRLWSRNIVIKPTYRLTNPMHEWFARELWENQIKKPFLIISCMIYLCNRITPNHQIKDKINKLFDANKNIEIYKYGFINRWKEEPIWK